MYQVIIAIHVLLGLGIIGLVMMQQGKGADAGASFGSGSAGSVFGAQGAASFLSRTTAILATLFFITSLGLAFINGHKGAALDIMSTTPATVDTPVVSDVPSTAPDVNTPVSSSEEDVVVKPPSMSQTASEVKTEAPAVAVPETVVQPAAVPVKEAEVVTIEVPKAEPIKAVDDKKEAAKSDSKDHKGNSKK
jgi:preprotein translocase subunit SecG